MKRSLKHFIIVFVGSLQFIQMGGENWNVDITQHMIKSQIMTSPQIDLKSKFERTCIFGLDVSHGSTANLDKPSIAAVSSRGLNFSSISRLIRQNDSDFRFALSFALF